MSGCPAPRPSRASRVGLVAEVCLLQVKLTTASRSPSAAQRPGRPPSCSRRRCGGRGAGRRGRPGSGRGGSRRLPRSAPGCTKEPLAPAPQLLGELSGGASAISASRSKLNDRPTTAAAAATCLRRRRGIRSGRAPASRSVWGTRSPGSCRPVGTTRPGERRGTPPRAAGSRHCGHGARRRGLAAPAGRSRGSRRHRRRLVRRQPGQARLLGQALARAAGSAIPAWAPVDIARRCGRCRPPASAAG